MRWQKTARIAIAIAVLVFSAIVFVALRRNTRPVPATPSPRVNPNTTTESTGIVHSRSEGGKLLFSITAEGSATFPDGTLKLKKARLTLPDRGGRTVEISSDEMEILLPPSKPDEIATAKMTRNVRMKTSDGLLISADAADFDQASGILRVPGKVEFSRERLKGAGLGATYDQARDVLWLLKDARISVAPDPAGQGAAEGSADSAGFARAEHYVRMTGQAKIDGDGRHAEASDITIQLSDDEKRIQTMQLRGNSRITGTGVTSGPQNMAARDIDLVYGPDGKALQQATLTESASVQLPGPAGAPGRQVGARNMVIGMAPDGSTVTSLKAAEQVEVTLPAAPDAPARRITSATLTAVGPAGAGIQTATFAGGVEFREKHPGGRGAPPSERIARSQRLIVETNPGFGDIQQADFRGNVRFEDGPTIGEAQRGIYKVAGDSLELTASSGDPGPPPRLSDERMSVEAARLTLELKTRKLLAEKTVRSSLQPSSRADGRSAGGKGRGEQPAQQGKLPSMLKSDEPVFVNANTMEYDGTSTAVYSGDARLFQGQTTVAGDRVTLDDKAGNMTAAGKVRTVMFFDDVDPKTKERKTTQTTGTADQLVYEDGKRLATYLTGPSGTAHIVGPQGDLTADKIQLFLKPKVNELERAEADGNVTVKEGERRAKGDHLTYTSADELYVMNGNPLEVDRYEPGQCTRTLGVTLRFRRGEDNLVIDGLPGVTPFNTKPIPCAR